MPAADSSPLLGSGGWIVVGIYVAVLVGIGLAARRARRENSLSDFYLSGRSMGLGVLLLTLYATQYSGLTLIGFAGKTYREGFTFLVSITFALGIIGSYLVFAPRLYQLSRKFQFVTVSDYIQHRYGSTPLTLLATLLLLAALANYILANLKAIGHLVVITTAEQVTFTQGIVVLSLVMVIYETLGGLRSVAWTDVLQGSILLVGCAVIFGLVQYHYGGLHGVADTLQQVRPDFWQPPDLDGKLLWVSTLVLVFFGPPFYPHAIQRIYAARDARTLRRSFQWMLLMPFVTSLAVITIALVGAAKFPGLDKNGSEEIVLVVLKDLSQQIPAARPMLILFLAAVLAAIMSTVDSALLAISSLFTKDLYARFCPDSSQDHLTRMGKLFSWLLMAVLVYLACVLPQTLWRLTEIKLELLCQAAPAIMLGVHFPRLTARGVLGGMVMGLAIALGLQLASTMTGETFYLRPWGIHAGVWGLMGNLIVIGLGARRGEAPRRQAAS